MGFLPPISTFMAGMRGEQAYGQKIKTVENTVSCPFPA
jgi:hypothetical protein